MADENTAAVPQPEQEQTARTRRIESGRGGGGGRDRDAGGFRIRLSDNELRAAHAIQEAFQLRSTVAALGFSIRTVAQLLEQGQLEAVLAEHRAHGGGARHEGAPRDGQRARRGAAEGRGERRSSRPDPFARPSRPPAPPAEAESAEAADQSPEAEISPPVDDAPQPSVEAAEIQP